MSLLSTLAGRNNSMRVSGSAFETRSLDALRKANAQLKATVNRYEAAQMGGDSRPWIPSYVRDARFDANSFTRWELTRKIRDAACNSWLIHRLCELYIRYSVGPWGLTVTPATGNKEWDAAMADAWGEWCQQPCKDALYPMSQVYRLEAGETHIDGEVFEVLTFRKPVGKKARPAIQMVESHRVKNGGPLSYGEETAGMVDGIKVDDSGRPTHASIFEGLNEGECTLRPFYNPERPIDGGVLHIFDPSRIGMYRAVTGYHSVLNEIQDIQLLESFEMDRAKAAGAIANIMITQTGEIPDMQKLYRDMATGQLGAAGSDPAATKKWQDLQNRIMQMQTVLGARTIALKPGEDMKQIGQTNPSAATQWFWSYQINKICIAKGFHRLLVLPLDNAQGTAIRGIIDDTNSYCRAQFAMFAAAAKAKYHFFADWAIHNVPGLHNAPANWRKCHVPPPREIGVDVGRDSVAKLAAYAAGVISLEDVVGPLGTTAERVTRRKAHNIADIKTIAAEVSAETGVEVKPEEISAPLAEILKSLGIAKQAEGIGEQATAIAEKTEEETE